MNHHSFAFGLAAALGLAAQERPADLTELPPVPTDYTPPKTARGDWAFTATYQIEFYNAGRPDPVPAARGQRSQGRTRWCMC